MRESVNVDSAVRPVPLAPEGSWYALVRAPCRVDERLSPRVSRSWMANGRLSVINETGEWATSGI